MPISEGGGSSGASGSSDGGLTAVSSDGTLTGSGTSGSPLKVAKPYAESRIAAVTFLNNEVVSGAADSEAIFITDNDFPNPPSHSKGVAVLMECSPHNMVANEWVEAIIECYNDMGVVLRRSKKLTIARFGEERISSVLAIPYVANTRGIQINAIHHTPAGTAHAFRIEYAIIMTYALWQGMRSDIEDWAEISSRVTLKHFDADNGTGATPQNEVTISDLQIGIPRAIRMPAVAARDFRFFEIDDAYEVVSILSGGGELIDDFAASVVLGHNRYRSKRLSMAGAAAQTYTVTVR